MATRNTNPTRKVGRPSVDIDKRTFEQLCGLLCTEEEIADFFDCSVDTICNWCKANYNENFSEVYKKKSSKGKISIRRYQMKLAETNPTMAIWLGKQMLGQKESVDVFGTYEDLTPLGDMLGKKRK